ncbi:hypothetical protein V1477_008065 [Vespula maculifrons]|uniref:Uncharacterized protein n=1 Tax=Vespula maculifrons TaxID=7453 RepID=A0ABD2CFF6_VESMC
MEHSRKIQQSQNKRIRMCFMKMRRLYEKRLFQQILLEGNENFYENLRKEWKRFDLHDKEITEERSKRKNCDRKKIFNIHEFKEIYIPILRSIDQSKRLDHYTSIPLYPEQTQEQKRLADALLKLFEILISGKINEKEHRIFDFKKFSGTQKSACNKRMNP